MLPARQGPRCWNWPLASGSTLGERWEEGNLRKRVPQGEGYWKPLKASGGRGGESEGKDGTAGHSALQRGGTARLSAAGTLSGAVRAAGGGSGQLGKGDLRTGQSRILFNSRL